MNNIVEKIRQATADLAGESGDIGSDNGQSSLLKQLKTSIDQFQSAFTDNLDELRQREDMVIRILHVQE